MIQMKLEVIRGESGEVGFPQSFGPEEWGSNILSEIFFPLKVTLNLKQVKKLFICRLLLFFFFLVLSPSAFSQEVDSTRQIIDFKGTVSVTNNGFSFIPSFSLGKPATIVDLSVGGKRFSFDPQFRFDLEGLKPWSLIFIWRYKLVQTDRFQLKPGVHLPALAFRTRAVEKNGVNYEEVFAQRFFTPELTSSYLLNRNISLGTYYIYGLGLEKAGQSRHTHFFSLNSSIRNIPLSKKSVIRMVSSAVLFKSG
jgi:hypothetical protein